MNTFRVLNSLDPDQDEQNEGPDLGPICLQRPVNLLPFGGYSLAFRIWEEIPIKSSGWEKNLQYWENTCQAFFG